MARCVRETSGKTVGFASRELNCETSKLRNFTRLMPVRTEVCFNCQLKLGSKEP